MQSSPSLKRRAFLALGGSALVAGCTSLAGSDTGSPTTTSLPPLDHERLRQAASRRVPENPPEAPVDGMDTYLERGRRRTRELLARFDERIGDVGDDADIEGMREIASRAETALQKSTTADVNSRALVEVRSARSDAAEALWWARAVLGEVNLGDALDTRRPVRDRLSEFRQRNWYIGPGIDTTLVAAKRVEGWADACENAIDAADSQEAISRVYRIGKAAGRVEAARSFLDDATFFVERLRMSETTDYAAAFEDVVDSVGNSLLKTVDSIDPRYAEKPKEMFEHEISNASAELVSRAYGGTAYHANWLREFKSSGAAASALVYATATSRDLRVFKDTRSAIEENGSVYPRLESADRIDDAKRGLVTTIEDVWQNPTHPGVESFHVYQLAIEVGNADHRMKTVLEGNYTEGQIYDAALELWAVPTLAEKRLVKQSTAITDLFEEINGDNS